MDPTNIDIRILGTHTATDERGAFTLFKLQVVA